MKRTYQLVFPDWGKYDTILKSEEPFVLWSVGEQCLLYHWLDYILNLGYERVELICSDRPARIREAMKRATLWPLEWEVVSVQEVDEVSGVPCLTGLPEHEKPDVAVGDGWSLVSYWMKLEHQWLANAYDGLQFDGVNLAIGRFCNIHPSAKINMPVWIGDEVYIGPNCEIGPNVSIGDRSVIAGKAKVQNAKVAHDTYLGEQTALENAFLDGGVLLNLKHETVISELDNFVAASLVEGEKPSVRERGLAFVLWVVCMVRSLWSSTGRSGERHYQTIKTFDGLELETLNSSSILTQRKRWLWQVILGRLWLFGVLPRTESQFLSLGRDWQEIIKHAHCGVFSYADSHGCHSPDDEMEAVHAVYEATHSHRDLSKITLRYVYEMMIRDG